MTGNSGSVYKSQINCCPRMVPVNIQLSPGLVMLDFYLYHGGKNIVKENCQFIKEIWSEKKPKQKQHLMSTHPSVLNLYLAAK